MHTRLFSRIVMLGAAPETRGSIAAVVESYRTHGLFRRWPVQFIPTHGSGGPLRQALFAATAAGGFARALAENGRLIVHVHASPGTGFWREAAFASAALAARCPVILHLHGTGFPPQARWVLEQAAAVCVPCEALRMQLRSLARNAHVVVIPPPVQIDIEKAEARPNLVVFLGHLEASKGIYELLDAIAAVRAAVPDVRLACAGEGDRIGVARYAERLGISDAVKFTGWVGPSGKRALLEHAAALALPSSEESLPMSLLEAMSAGVPVVASAVGGIPEVLADGVNGFLVAPGDKRSLERALRRLLIDRPLGERLGAAARESLRYKYSPERALARLEELYEAAGARSLEVSPRVAVPLKKAA